MLNCDLLFQQLQDFSISKSIFFFLFFLIKHTTQINQELMFFFFVLAKNLERNKLRKLRKQILDMTRSKENPRITGNNEN
jgi:hypothetical protein